jgi:hypothetical protein
MYSIFIHKKKGYPHTANKGMENADTWGEYA